MAPAARSTLRPAAPAPSKVKQPRATIAPVKRVRNTSSKRARAVNRNLNLGRYPWDDFQDAVVVNSVELRYDDPEPLAGAEHYLHLLSQQKESYKHICTHPDEYRKLPDTPSEPDEEADDSDSDSRSDTLSATDYTRPARALASYEQPVYETEILSPAIFLAVIRIAQKNHAYLDFVSALGHLPNLPVSAPLPKLPPGIFAADAPANARDADAKLHLVFLPAFYVDGRHALGYYEVTDDDTDPRLATCLFTPCSTPDLVKYNLVEWYAGRKGGDVGSMKAVGGREGRWLHADVVEDWKDWKFGVRVAGALWKRRLLLCLGGEEDGGRAE